MFQFNRSVAPYVRQSSGAQTLSRNIGGGQVFLRAADTPSIFASKNVGHCPTSKMLEKLLLQHDRRQSTIADKDPWRDGSSSSTWSLPFTPSNTLARPDIATHRKKRMMVATKLANKKWRSRALWRARRLGYSTEEALEEITTFQKFVSKAEQVQVPESSSHPSANAKMKNYLGGTCSGISEAEREAERISLASQIRMDLQQLMKAIGILYYPNLMSGSQRDSSGSDNDSDDIDHDVSSRRSNQKLLQDISMWLLQRHSQTGFIDIVQWLALVSSGDIDIALEEATLNRTAVFVLNKGGTYRPTKGHLRPSSAFVSSLDRTCDTKSTVVKVRQAKKIKISTVDKTKVQQYIEHRGVRLGMKRADINKAKKDALNQVESLKTTNKKDDNNVPNAQRRRQQQRRRNGTNGSVESVESVRSAVSIKSAGSVRSTGTVLTELDISSTQMKITASPPKRRAASARTRSPQSRHRRLVKSRPNSRHSTRQSSQRVKSAKNTNTRKSKRDDDDVVLVDCPTTIFYSGDHFMHLTESLG